jgi:hypothetical protein
MSTVSRRELLLASGALGTVRLAGAVGQKDITSHAGTDIVSLTAVELSERIRSRQISCTEVMEAYLRQIERYNPKVNAIVSLQDRDSLLRQAKERDAQLAKGQYLGWMHGFPHAVKDLAATKGIRTSYGSPLLDGVPDHDSLFVERLRHSGAILIGKDERAGVGVRVSNLQHRFRHHLQRLRPVKMRRRQQWGCGRRSCPSHGAGRRWKRLYGVAAQSGCFQQRIRLSPVVGSRTRRGR